ncbi:MAG: trypsin-like peptidase domain-containing protein [Oscillibacter sp.]
MDENQDFSGDRVPGEIVEYYHSDPPREVVETYTRPLPETTAVSAPRRHSKKGLVIFLICCGVVVALAAVSFWVNSWLLPNPPNGFEQFYDQPAGETSPGAVSIPTYPTGQGETLPLSLKHGEAMPIQDIYRQLNPAVVTVMAQLDDGVSIGTGVIFTQDGYVLTNYHVVENGSDCTIALDTGHTFSALYVAGDQANDLAVLKVNQTGLPAAQFGDSENLTVGDTVYAIGNPLGVKLRGTLTDGIVSAINRDVQVDGRRMTLIQTNAALNFGNSGGPLINVYGQVVGINTIKMSSAYSNIEGLGFAIPSASIEYLVNDLLAYGEVRPKPQLGITVSQTGVALPDGRLGVEIFSVTPGSSAEAGGILVGDILTQANGKPVTSSRELLQIRNNCQIGDELALTVWRGRGYVDLQLTLDMAA